MAHLAENIHMRLCIVFKNMDATNIFNREKRYYLFRIHGLIFLELDVLFLEKRYNRFSHKVCNFLCSIVASFAGDDRNILRVGEYSCCISICN